MNHPCRLVVVDSSADGCTALRLLLELDGYDVRTAVTIGQALRAVAEHRPVCALVDFASPALDAVTLCRQLRADHGDGLVLIALSAWRYDIDRDAAEAAGADAVVVKPIDATRLREILAAVSADAPYVEDAARNAA
jgi:CheY-like chemotaxis protein